MVRHVVSLVTSPPGLLGGTGAAMEANAFAIAEDVDLTVVLRGGGVGYAVTADPPAAYLSGVPLAVGAGSQDLRGLLESGIRIVVDRAALIAQGIPDDAVVSGVQIAEHAELADTIANAEGVLTW